MNTTANAAAAADFFDKADDGRLVGWVPVIDPAARQARETWFLGAAPAPGTVVDHPVHHWGETNLCWGYEVYSCPRHAALGGGRAVKVFFKPERYSGSSWRFPIARARQIEVAGRPMRRAAALQVE